MQSNQILLPPPPRLITSLAAGFEKVANSIAVIALPVLFDLFLWFGPHLRLERLTRPWLESLPRLYGQMLTTADIEAVRDLWAELLSQFNLFAALRTFPVGISSLLSLEMPVQTPMGAPVIFEVGSFLEILGWSVLAVLTGWLIGALYYYWVSRVSLQPASLQLGKSVTQVLLLSLIWVVVLLGVGIPAAFLLSLTALISPAVGEFVLFAAAILLLWVLVPVYFSAHGIFTYEMNALNAIVNSLRMIRFTLPTSFLFLFMLVIIGQGLRFLWTTPPQDSWWMLVGILGHAFISTALLASSFIYYRDVNNWLKVVLEQMKKQIKPAHV